MSEETALSLPPPESFALERQPGINPDLIRESVAAGNIDYLISIFDYQRRAMCRAEALSVAYFRQMEVLHKRLEAAKRGERSGEVRATLQEPKVRLPCPAKPRAPAINLDDALDL